MHLREKIKGSSFVRNVLVIMSGSALAQIISYALTPIISRLFSPDDFGIFGSFDSVCTVISAGITLQYTQAIIIAKRDEDGIQLFLVSILCTLCVGVLSLIVCAVVPDAINQLLQTEGVWALALLVLAPLVSGVNQSLQAWCIRAKAFAHGSASQVVGSVAANGTRVGLGFLNGGAAGLIVSQILGSILACFNLLRVLIPDFLRAKPSFRRERIFRLAKEYKEFPLFGAPQNIIWALSSGLPVLLLSYYYGIAVAGAYAFAMRVLHVPLAFVRSALQQVLFQKAAETYNHGGSLTRLFLKTTTGLFALSLLPTVVLLIWAPEIFTWLFGPQWDVSGRLAQSLVIWMSIFFWSLPAVLVTKILRMLRFTFLFEIVVLGGRCLLLVLGGMYLTVGHTVVAFSIMGALMEGILIFWVGYTLIKKEESLNWQVIWNRLAKE